MASGIVAIPELQRFYAEALAAAGADPDAASVGARGLVYADSRGVESHGAANFERIYIRRLLDGRIDGSARPRIECRHGATAVLNAQRCLGFLAASEAMEEAITLARRFGVGAVGVRGSTHCGAMAFYTQAALDAGMVGFAFTNTGAQRLVRPPTAAQPMLGTNVVAAAAGAETRAPFSLDMSTAVVSTGRLRTAVRRGETVPEGWLVDDRGRSVGDPAAYFDGSAHLQFLGGSESTSGYKGYGLALLVDLLCGALLGGEVGSSGGTGGGDVDGGIGHFMLALDIGAFRDRSGFGAQMDAMLGALEDCPPTNDAPRVLYPGLKEHEHAARGLVEIGEELLASLRRVADQLAVAPPSLLDAADAR